MYHFLIPLRILLILTSGMFHLNALASQNQNWSYLGFAQTYCAQDQKKIVVPFLSSMSSSPQGRSELDPKVQTIVQANHKWTKAPNTDPFLYQCFMFSFWACLAAHKNDSIESNPEKLFDHTKAAKQLGEVSLQHVRFYLTYTKPNNPEFTRLGKTQCQGVGPWEPIEDPSLVPHPNHVRPVDPNIFLFKSWRRPTFSPQTIQPSPIQFDFLMEHIKTHWDKYTTAVKSLIVGALLIYFGGNAIALFFSGGASLSTVPATAGLLVIAIVGILNRHHLSVPGLEQNTTRADLHAPLLSIEEFSPHSDDFLRFKIRSSDSKASLVEISNNDVSKVLEKIEILKEEKQHQLIQ